MNILVNNFCKDVLLQSNFRPFRTASNRYIKQITLLSKPYQHHRAISANDEQLVARFKWETALYHVVAGMLGELIKLHYPSLDPSYLYQDRLDFFDWYQADAALKEELRVAVAEIKDIPFDEFILALSEICGQLLIQSNSRTTGEFYTPLSLAEHLINISNLSSEEILGKGSLVDPSCGGGIILLTVAVKVVRHALCNSLSPSQAIDALTSNLHGYDIQPFAINLARLMLRATCAPLYTSVRDKTFTFSNVRLLDPLQKIKKSKFNYVIGNPPYLPVKRKQLSFISKYEEVVYGHVNLYGLFLWWAVKAASNGGTIAYLVPQTLSSGLYFEKLRSSLHGISRIRSITRMTDRKGVIGDADQQVMAICLQKRDRRLALDTPEVDVIVTHNGTDIAECMPTPVFYNNLVKLIDSKPIWVISDNPLDYDIQDIIEKKLAGTIGNLAPTLTCQNGGFVWNQYQDAITHEEAADTIPLVSSGTITPFKFKFFYPTNNPQYKRAFVKWDDASKEKKYRGISVLIQRVTARKAGRRLIAAMVSDDFTQQYEEYFVENHVNAIIGDELDLLFGITAWINSDIAQFLFQMRNGNAQISVYELQNLPCSKDLLVHLAPISRQITKSNQENVEELLLELNKSLISYFSLTPLQVSRISEALSEKSVAL